MSNFNVEKYEIKTNESINKRICLISDIHADNWVNEEFFDKLIKQIRTTNPDYIVIAGDIVDSGSVLENDEIKTELESFISELGKITKTIVTLGNHDIMNSYNEYKENKKYINWFKSLIKYHNIYYIYNNSIVFKDIEFITYLPKASWFANKDKDYYYKEFKKDEMRINVNNNYKIFISHSPVSLFTPENHNKLPEITDNINLILSGHMHNGVLPEFLEFLDFKKVGRGIVSPAKKMFPKQCRGMQKIKDVDIIVSRGIRKFNYPSFFKIFNFLYKKEITIIDLK